MKKSGVGLLGGIGIGLVTTVGVAMAASGGFAPAAPVSEPVVQTVQAVVGTTSLPIVATTTVATSTPNTVTAPTVKKAAVVAEPAVPKVVGTPSTSKNVYYTNSDGNQIHVPVQADSVPAGVTAQCRDGSYSYSQHRSGTCSHHGGVDTWL